ncbi:sensor histidine kinase [Paenibacillus tyrfis]|uniref:sensor histidine kinase n=1 Tax=Paenibacillus tyrfis TaxID=1501230 RepID=UPI00249086A4|nr:sensor histidine kinase [Paenibacillus tyrfis]GLI09203.1 sensor histidine kinase [Paenibacillus tyrfis]
MKLRLPFRLFPENMRHFGFIWIINMTIPLYYLLQLPFQKAWIGYAAVAILAFAFRQALWNTEGRLVYALIQITSVAILGYVYNPSFLYFGFYCIMAIGMLPTVRKVAFTVAYMVAAFVLTLYLFYQKAGEAVHLDFIPSLIILAILPFAMNSHRKAEQLRKQLRSANDEIERLIKNEERQRIARDLHDTLGHTLSLITLKGELVERLIPHDPERAVQEAKDIQATSRTVLKQVRELISDMRAVHLADELRQAGQILSSAGIGFETAGDAKRIRTSPVVMNILSMCLREAVTNVVKHSRAKHCKVELMEKAGSYVLKVHDDGVGIDGAGSELGQAGSGMLGMKERLSLIEGTLEFSKREETGTTLIITVPNVVKRQQTEGNR